MQTIYIIIYHKQNGNHTTVVINSGGQPRFSKSSCEHVHIVSVLVPDNLLQRLS